MAFSYISQSDACSSSSSTGPLTTTVAPAGGDTVVVFVTYSGPATTVTVTDNIGNAYAQVGPSATNASGMILLQFEAHNCAAGSGSISMSLGAARFNRAVAQLTFRGLAPAAAESGNGGGGTVGAGATTTSGTISPATQPGLLVGMSMGTGTSAPFVDSGFTDDGAWGSWDANLSFGTDVAWRRLTSTAATAVTFINGGGFSDDFITEGMYFSEVGGAPVFSQHPQSARLRSGDTYSTTVVASGSPTSYLWEKNTGSGWTTIGGATTATLSFSVVTSDSGTQYRCTATNAIGSTTSNAATLVVDALTFGTLGDFDPELLLKAWW